MDSLLKKGKTTFCFKRNLTKSSFIIFGTFLNGKQNNLFHNVRNKGTKKKSNENLNDNLRKKNYFLSSTKFQP